MGAVRTVGFWLAAVMGALQAVNAVRAFADPGGFAAYMGLPLADATDASFVYVYGLRTAFIAVLIGFFLIRGGMEALSLMAMAAILMPVGDAILTWRAGAEPATIARHALIAVYVLVAFVFLRRGARRLEGEGAA